MPVRWLIVVFVADGASEQIRVAVEYEQTSNCVAATVDGHLIARFREIAIPGDVMAYVGAALPDGRAVRGIEGCR